MAEEQKHAVILYMPDGKKEIYRECTFLDFHMAAPSYIRFIDKSGKLHRTSLPYHVVPETKKKEDGNAS